MEAFTSRIKQLPLVGPAWAWAERHPRLAAWIVLAAGMVVILAIEARDVGLAPGQWLALVVATVLVAGACIWIVSWEDEDDASTAKPGAETPDEASATDALPDNGS